MNDEKMKELENRIAVLEGQVQAQPENFNIGIKVSSPKTYNDIINENMKKIDTSIQCFIMKYANYIETSVINAKKGLPVDEKAIYALSDAVRTIGVIKKIFKEKILDYTFSH